MNRRTVKGLCARHRGRHRRGSFARVLGRYVRDEKVLPLADAVRRMSGLPAATLGLSGRGVLRAGGYADIVVFDPATVAGRACWAASEVSDSRPRLIRFSSFTLAAICVQRPFGSSLILPTGMSCGRARTRSVRLRASAAAVPVRSRSRSRL